MCSRGPTGELRCLGQSNGVLMYPGRGEAPGWGTWEKERGFFEGGSIRSGSDAGETVSMLRCVTSDYVHSL